MSTDYTLMYRFRAKLNKKLSHVMRNGQGKENAKKSIGLHVTNKYHQLDLFTVASSEFKYNPMGLAVLPNFCS